MTLDPSLSVADGSSRSLDINPIKGAIMVNRNRFGPVSWPLLAVAAALHVPAFSQTVNAGTPQVYTMSPTSVKMSSGTFEPQFTDFVIGPLKFIRGGPEPSFQVSSKLGFHHSFGSGVYVGTSGSDVVATVIADSRAFKFRRNADLGWNPWSQEAQGTDLTFANGSFTFLDRDGDVYEFMPHAALTNSVMPNGTQVLARAIYADGTRLDYSYNGSALVRTVLGNRGYAVVLDYTSNDAIAATCGYNLTVQYVSASSTCGGAALKVGYAYTVTSSTNLLSGVTDVMGKPTSITYTSNSLISCITIPGTQTCEMTNVYGPQPGEDPTITKANQVRKQTLATGEVWQFSYVNDTGKDETPLQPGEIRTTYTTMVPPIGGETLAEFGNGVPTWVEGPTGRMSYQFSGSVLKKFTFPEGNGEDLYRDNRDNILTRTLKAKPASGAADIVSTASYPDSRFDPPSNALRLVGCYAASQKLCDKPVYKIDPNGNRTDYTYDAAHGMVLTETGPTVGGVRPQTRYTYGQRYAWINNGSGGYSRAATPVWVLTQKSVCRTGAASGAGCAVAGDEVRTVYDYGPDSGPNNLLLRGLVEDATGTALRTCYRYDWQGTKISETRPNAALTSCP